MNHAERMKRFEETDLYVVITESFCGGRSALEVLDACLDAGVRLVQFREKYLEGSALYERAAAFCERTAAAGALLIIDDRVDIALAVGPDGGPDGPNAHTHAPRRPNAPEDILGASSHNPDEAMAAQAAGASYVNIGPIFDTQTKAVSSGAVGPEMIGRIAPRLSVPFTCMGGIKGHNIGEVLSRGARHPAVVTAVTTAPDVRAAAAGLRELILDARKP